MTARPLTPGICPIVIGPPPPLSTSDWDAAVATNMPWALVRLSSGDTAAFYGSALLLLRFMSAPKPTEKVTAYFVPERQVPYPVTKESLHTVVTRLAAAADSRKLGLKLTQENLIQDVVAAPLSAVIAQLEPYPGSAQHAWRCFVVRGSNASQPTVQVPFVVTNKTSGPAKAILEGSLQPTAGDFQSLAAVRLANGNIQVSGKTFPFVQVNAAWKGEGATYQTDGAESDANGDFTFAMELVFGTPAGLGKVEAWVGADGQSEIVDVSASAS